MSTKRRMTILEALKFGFAAYSEHFGLILGFLVTSFLLILAYFVLLILQVPLLRYILRLSPALYGSLRFLLPLFFGLAGTLFLLFFIFFVNGLYLGGVQILLDIYHKGDSNFSRLFSCFKLSPRGVGGGILYNTISGVGKLLLFIPGIIWGIRFDFYSYFIVDAQVGVIKSLRLSYRTTKGYFWKLFFLGIISMLGSLLSAGLLAPAFSLANIKFYAELRKEKGFI